MTDLDVLARELRDRYRVERELGRGGMATVWLAHDVRHDRPVALKVLRRELGAALGRERFLHEIRLTARLQHPRILPLLDSGEAAGLLWYTMPFVDGESLRQRLAREPTLPVRNAVAIAREVADALAHAHAKGIVHRDIKPENILLADGGALVADFGIARAVDAVADERLTGTGLALGTPAYMSPEQSVGERELDGRTDVYALGCVLFEMLCGATPFADGTVPAMLARRLTEPAPSARARRPEIPSEIDATLARALAREPSARFPTAAAFADALDAGSTPAQTTALSPRPRRHAVRLLTMLAALAAAVLLVVLLAAQRRRQASAAPSPDLIAVAPFDALDPTLELWRDGMTDVLSRYLDGAGPLRTVAPSTVIRQWRGRADRASAEALSRRVGAGVVIVGDLTPTSRDSVRLRATVVTATGGQGEDVEVRGPADRIGELADSLGRSILIVLGRHRPIGAVAGAPITGTTLPALKAFLQGEQFYRRGLYDSALVHFQRASDADTTFALAYQRMVVTLWFSPRTAGAYRAVEYYAARALRALGSLAGRDSLLIVGVSCLVGLEADGARPGGEASRFRCADSTARTAVKRFPGDPESWYLLGEVYTHMSVLMGGTVDDEFAMYQRALDLDSTFTPAYEHAIGLALETGRPKLALRYVTTAATQARQDPRSARYTLVLTLLDPATARTPAAESLLANATATELWDALADLRQSEDSGEAAIRLARSLRSQPHDRSGAPDWVVDSVQQRRTLATMLARRGRLREASDLVHLDTPDGFQNPYFGLAALKVVPASDVDAAMRRRSRTRPSTTWYYNVDGWTRELAWWRERGDSLELLRLATRLEQSPPALPPGAGLRLARQARAYVRLLAADSASALQQLASLPDSTCLDSESCAEPRLLLARLLVAQGRLEEGARVMDQWLGQADGALGPMLWLERARLAERLRDREKALRQYARVVAAWRSADPSLQPYLAEAREGLRRLTEERTTESR